MTSFPRSLLRPFAVALLGLTLAGTAQVPAVAEEAAATRDYNAAVRLHNVGSYDLAAEAWEEFLGKHPNDARAGVAQHYLGVCYYQQEEYDAAADAFRRAAGDESQTDAQIREQASLYLGIALYESARRSDDSKAYTAAGDVFARFLEEHPQSKLLPQALFYRAECLYMSGEKDAAADAYRQFLRDYPQHVLVPEVLFALGVCEEERGNPGEAEKLYARFLADHADHPLRSDVLSRQGEVLFAAEKYEEAAQRFAEVAGEAGDTAAEGARIRQADCLVQLRQYEQAASIYAQVAARGGDMATEAALATGRCLYLAGKIEEALGMLNRARSDAALQAEAAHWIARCQLKQNKPAEALKTTDAALRASPDDHWAALLAMDRADALYADTQRRADAIAVYVEVASKYPKDSIAPEALYAAAYAALELGRYEEARRHAATFRKQYAGSDLLPDVLHIEAESLLLEKQYDQSAERYRQLLAEHKEHPDATLWQTRLATALSLSGKHQEVLSLLSPVTENVKNPARRAEMQLLVGAAQLALGHLQEAVGALEAALATDPRGDSADRALVLLATAQHRQGETATARSTLERLIADFPDSPLLDRAHFRLGEYAHAERDSEAAEAAYRRVLFDFPQSPLVPEVMYELGRLLLNTDRPAEAETILTQLLEKDGGGDYAARAHLARGLARQQLKKHDAANTDLQAALEADLPDQEKADARYALALVQIDQGEYDAAVNTLKQLLSDSPDYSGRDSALYQLAWALKLSGEEDQATERFAQLAEDYPDSSHAVEAHYHLGEVRYKAGEFNKAAVEYYTAMKAAKDPELGEKATHRLGWAYFKSNQYENARQTFAYQRRTYPQGPLATDAAFMEAESAFKQEKYAEALAIYQELQPLDSEDFEILRLLHAGQAAAQLAQWGEAIKLLQRCAEQFPDAPELPEALYEQGYAWQNQGDAERAMSLYNRVIAESDGETAARAQFMIGELHFSQKQYDEAVKSFFKVAYGYPFPQWQADATFEAARCFELLGRPSQAVKMYQELVEKFPESDKVNDAKAKLAALGQ